MGFFNNTNQLLTNIEWKDQVPNTLVWRFPNPSDVLQRNSTVTVTQNQAMVFYNDGKPEGAITEPGQYDLKTNSLPFFSSMMAVFRGGETKHKAQVYFVNTLMITNVKWGTIAPINYIDPLIQQNVGLRAFGNYSFQIADAGLFVHNYIGNRDELTLDEFQETITGRIITPIGDALATAQYGFTEIASHRDDLSKSIGEKIAGEFTTFGFTFQDFRIESTDFDEATQALYAQYAEKQSLVAQSKVLAGMDDAGLENMEKLAKLEALKSAAANPNGIAGMGVGMGVGVGLGANMASSFQQNPQQPAQPQAPTQVPPTPPTTPPVEPQPPVNPTQGA